MVDFIDQMRHERSIPVERTCQALSEAGMKFTSRAYRAAKTQPASKRCVRDGQIIKVLEGLRSPDRFGRLAPESMYGVRKMWRWLQLNGFPNIARCTVERLMRKLGMKGLVRGKGTVTTKASKTAKRAPDLLNRDFNTDRPNTVWVTDFTYVPTWNGWCYVSLVIDLFARMILGWAVSTSKDVSFVEDALQMATWTRDQEGHSLPVGLDPDDENRVIHHSDAGSQYTALRYTDTIELEGLRPSIGTVGDAYDNAEAESVMGLYKHEAVRKDSPFRTGPLKNRDDVEAVTLDWVNWYNTKRLHSKIGYLPPQEAENQYYQNSSKQSAAA